MDRKSIGLYVVASLILAISCLSCRRNPRDEALVRDKLPRLSALVKPNPSIYRLLIEYGASVFRPERIKTEDSLMALFKKKDELMRQLDQEYDDKFTWQVFLEHNLESESWERELRSIGMDWFSVEDMYAGLTDYPFLKETISEIASEPCRMFIDMKIAIAESYGGEYTYMDLAPEMKAVAIGESLLQLFPSSEYAALMEGMFCSALHPLTDVHKVMREDGNEFYIVEDMEANYYPTATDPDNYRAFLENYPRSRFHDIVKRIVANMSEIEIENGRPEDIHAIVVDEYSDEEAAKKAVFSYLMQGMDIPHVIEIKEGEGSSYASVYRFYSNRQKTEDALKNFREIKPKAKIITIS